MNYSQHIAQAMLKMGDGDQAGAELDFKAALEEARRVDPDGPREAEVLNYMALFYVQQSRLEEAGHAKSRAETILMRFEDHGS